ncbi:SAM-dependent methyltransferase [Streptomyces sp. NPDC058280]|uniref:SAM-dependent methyltransferase n=1 Tax=Streptomyces sp. NPDC058280 TaxID=3346419 RepID=UPI0036ED257E
MTDETEDLTRHQELDLQPHVPHSARFWNCLLGGKDYFEADRLLAEQMMREWPAAVDIARASRAFLGRTVRHLAGEADVRQFLDLGTGLPTADNTHEVAQRVAPDARIVYVDHDPIVLVHARALLTSTPEGATDYLDADLTDPDAVLTQAARTLDLDQPVALMLLSTIGHVTDPAAAAKLVRTYMARLAPGSYLVLCTTLDSPEVAAANVKYAASGTHPYTASTAEEMTAMAAGLTIPPPGLGPINRWYPEGQMDPDVDQWGYVARKE